MTLPTDIYRGLGILTLDMAKVKEDINNLKEAINIIKKITIF